MTVTNNCSTAATVPFNLTVNDEQYIGKAYINLHGTVDYYPDEEEFDSPCWNDFDFDNSKGEYHGFDLSLHTDVADNVLDEIYDRLIDLISSSWQEITCNINNFEGVY